MDCKSVMPEGYTADEMALIREEIRATGGLFGTSFAPRKELFVNPMLQLFVGYANASNGDDFIALGYLENAEILAYERNYCNKKIVREFAAIGRYHVITRLEAEFTDNHFYKNLTHGSKFSPSGMYIMLFRQAECMIFSSDIEIVMSDTNFEQIYSRLECFEGDRVS